MKVAFKPFAFMDRLSGLLPASLRKHRRQGGYISIEPAVTGGTATNFLTSPVFTTVKDKPLDTNQNQVACTALASGTATNGRYHTPSDPCTVTSSRPKSIKTLQSVGEDLDQFNEYSVLTRKGVKCRSTGEIRTMTVRTVYRIPVGAEVYDAVNVAIGASLHHGLTAEESSGIIDTIISGLLGEQE